MTHRTLGEVVRELREKADLSLRELAKKIDVSPPFLSDLELGRRYPSDETLQKIAKALKVTAEELKQHDHRIRDSVADLKRLIESNPRLGFAFRTAVDELKQGKLTAEQFEQRVKGGAKDQT
jgi:transcriptional regulator with XRE-family HTH domain